MLARLELKLNADSDITFQMASLFHGALMEKLPQEYANQLHQSQLHPYSQYLGKREGDYYWIINCLNQEARDIIIGALLATESIELRKKQLKVGLLQHKYEELSQKELMDDFYEDTKSRWIEVKFLTPTAFKQRGRYLFYPDIRCIYQSLMNKFDSCTSGESMIDEDTLEELSNHSEIVSYHLRSVSFALEGVNIPAFMGRVRIRLRGSQTMVNFANLLFRFGTYSGVGIKTALGMGAIGIGKERGGEREGKSS